VRGLESRAGRAALNRARARQTALVPEKRLCEEGVSAPVTLPEAVYPPQLNNPGVRGAGQREGGAF